MNDRQLEVVIRANLPNKCVQQFWGCFTSDVLAKIVIKPNDGPVIIIANILPSTMLEKMGHWVCFYIKDRIIYLLDSFGMKPEIYTKYFNSVIKHHEGFKLWRLHYPIQDQMSYNCGVYVLYFIPVICIKGIEKLQILLKELRHGYPHSNDICIAICL